MRIPPKRLLALPALAGLLVVGVVAAPIAHASSEKGGASDVKRLTDDRNAVVAPSAVVARDAAVAQDAAGSSSLSQPVKAQGQLGPGKGTVFIGLEPPSGAKLTAGSPVVIEASGEGLKFPSKLKTQMEPGSPVALPVEVDESSPGKAQIKLSYYWCHSGDSGQCVREHAELAVSLDLTGDAPGGEAFFSYRARTK
ncbi:MAG: hypothetical protein R3B07_22380 [Polyangiaceae bacterium]